MKNLRTLRVCIIGLGPAGIGAALTLSKFSKFIDLICIDAGVIQEKRNCLVLSNKTCDGEEFCQVICGFGGAALICGGKISAFPAGNGLVYIYGSVEATRKALAEALDKISSYMTLKTSTCNLHDIEAEKSFFEAMGFQYRYYDAYLYEQKNLAKAFLKIFQDLKAAGTSLLLNSKLVEIKRQGAGFDLAIEQEGKPIHIYSDYTIFAVGRSGRDMLRRVNSMMGLGGEENSLDLGVRLEFSSNLFTEKVKCHNDLKLLFGNARTFCVCKDGKVVDYLAHGIHFTEGYCTFTQKTGLTNLGITVRLPPAYENEIVLTQVMGRMMKLSNGKVISQSLADYLNANLPHKKTTAPLGTLPIFEEGNINLCFPETSSTLIRNAVSYFASRFFPESKWNEIRVYAPEVDYGGLRFPLSSDFSVSPGLYLIGDCTGRFRGILQAFCSGLSCAENIIGDLYEKR